MISYIKGNVLHTGTNYVILERHGLGYKVFVTPTTLEQAHAGQELEIYTHLKVTDSEQTLYGMPSLEALDFFELLITVSGVGPKMALTILSAAKKDVLENAIASADIDIFTRMSGVGKKTAERIILELKNKVGSLTSIAPGGSDTYDALVALGYSTKEARDVLPHIDTSLPSEQQLKQALKFLSKT